MRRSESRAGAVLAVAGIALASGAVGWAGATVFAPAAEVPEVDYAMARVVEGEVSSTIGLSAAAEWVKTSSATNQASGVVTSVNIGAGDPVPAGAVLYTVGLRPVVLARGAVPAFRAIAPEASGADVAQLQSFLTELGLYGGPADGQYGAGTREAVEAWQTSLGIEPDGVIQPGDLVFVPELPARIVLDTATVSAGATLAGGERAIGILASIPRFTVTVSSGQSAGIPPDTTVEVIGPAGDVWSARAGARTTDDEGTVVIELESETGVCGDACGTIPLGDGVTLDSSVVLVTPTAGLVVPSAALVTRADGSAVVVDDAGNEHPVTVVASARGTSVIEGVAAGTLVRIPQTEGG